MDAELHKLINSYYIIFFLFSVIVTGTIICIFIELVAIHKTLRNLPEEIAKAELELYK